MHLWWECDNREDRKRCHAPSLLPPGFLQFVMSLAAPGRAGFQVQRARGFKATGMTQGARMVGCEGYNLGCPQARERMNRPMSAQVPLKQEARQARQEDFAGASLATNGSQLRSLPSGFYYVGAARGSGPLRQAPRASETPAQRVDLIASTSVGVAALPMILEAELWPNNRPRRLHFYDDEEMLDIDLFPAGKGKRSGGNVDIRVVGKPLEQALRASEFLDLLIRHSGGLSLRIPDGSPERPLADLPISAPEPEMAAHGERLRTLRALQEIWTETGVEVRYPDNTEDREGLDNLNFVLKAIRSGWVVQQVTNFRTDTPASGIRELCDELRSRGEALRAFYFEIPRETYRVFDKQIDLGPSRRYLSAARLTTSLEEMARWLTERREEQTMFSARWEPVEEAPLHIFFDQWPQTSLASVERDLRELEMIYETTSDVFRQGWIERETWARDITDGKRWLSLLEAREELPQEA